MSTVRAPVHTHRHHTCQRPQWNMIKPASGRKVSQIAYNKKRSSDSKCLDLTPRYCLKHGKRGTTAKNFRLGLETRCHCQGKAGTRVQLCSNLSAAAAGMRAKVAPNATELIFRVRRPSFEPIIARDGQLSCTYTCAIFKLRTCGCCEIDTRAFDGCDECSKRQMPNLLAIAARKVFLLK